MIGEQAPVLLIAKRLQNRPLCLALRHRESVKEKQGWNKNQASDGKQGIPPVGLLVRLVKSRVC